MIPNNWPFQAWGIHQTTTEWIKSFSTGVSPELLGPRMVGKDFARDIDNIIISLQIKSNRMKQAIFKKIKTK